MNFALRDLDSGLFYSGDEWTSLTDRAFKFTDAEQVEEFVKGSSLKGVEMVILVDGEVVGGVLVQTSDSD